MLSRLESLPQELLEQVIGHLDHDLLWLDRVTGLAEHRPTLLDVSSVSRTLRSACDPFVFRAFPFQSFREPTRPFLRSLCERPHLPQYVWKLWITLDNNDISVPSENDRQLLTAAMTAFARFDWHQRVLTALLNGCHKAEAFLLFAICNKLRELRLGVDDTIIADECGDSRGDQPFCQHCDEFSIASCIASLLAKLTPASYRDLKTVEVYNSERPKEEFEESGNQVTADLPGPLLRLPHLEKLVMKNCRIQGLTFDSAEEHANQLSLKSLILADCEFDSEEFTTLIRCCRALEVVEITWDEDTPMNASALFAALDKHHDSLRNLELGTYGFVDVGDAGAFGKLHLFKSLRSLYINLSLLIGDMPWDSDDITLPTFPDELSIVTLRTESSVEDLDTILTILEPQMTENIFDLRLTFPIHEANVEYVDKIHATDLTPWPRSLADERGWTMYLSRGDDSSLFIGFCCWLTKTKSVALILRDLLRELVVVGIEGLLEKHFDGCEIEEAEAELLENLRDIVRSAWQVEED